MARVQLPPAGYVLSPLSVRLNENFILNFLFSVLNTPSIGKCLPCFSLSPNLSSVSSISSSGDSALTLKRSSTRSRSLKNNQYSYSVATSLFPPSYTFSPPSQVNRAARLAISQTRSISRYPSFPCSTGLLRGRVSGRLILLKKE